MTAAEKYAIKAREFQRLATKIAEEAGGKIGEEIGEEEGASVGGEAGGIAGERVGREAGEKVGFELAGEDGGKVGAKAGAKAGKKFGLKVGKEAGLKAGIEVGRLEGRKAGGAAGAAEALKHFKIGITKDRVAALKRIFAEVGHTAGISVAKKVVVEVSAKRGYEEGSKFALEHGSKAGKAAARKLKEAEDKAIKEEGSSIGENAGAEAGEKAAEEEGEKLGREIGAEVAKLAGMKMGKKMGRTIGAKVGRAAGKQAGIEHAAKIALEISREKVTALRKMFSEVTMSAGRAAAMKAARAEVMKSVHDIAVRAAVKAVREKLLALASQRKLQLSNAWKPTALIAVINARSDLSDMEKIKLAAKAKMEGNLGDLLPKKFASSAALKDNEDPLSGQLQFKDDSTTEQTENVDNTKKWKTVVFSELPDDPQKKDLDMSKEKVSSLKKRFETSSMKNNEAYVIM